MPKMIKINKLLNRFSWYLFWCFFKVAQRSHFHNAIIVGGPQNFFDFLCTNDYSLQLRYEIRHYREWWIVKRITPDKSLEHGAGFVARN